MHHVDKKGQHASKRGILIIGLAIFTMFFGAGNVVFPLLLGRQMGDHVGYAIIGFLIMAVFVPLLGLLSTMLFEGDYRAFLGQMGRVPGAIITFVCMILIGPFGATPRCLALSFAAIHWHIPSLTLFIFSIIASGIILALTVKKGRVVDILGRFLGPVKITLLLSIIVLGLASPFMCEPVAITAGASFFQGLHDGYFTLDLLSGIFFAGLIYRAIKQRLAPSEKDNGVMRVGIKAGAIGALLLGGVYIGYSFVAAMYGPHVHDVAPDHLLSALATTILGQYAGILANAAVAVACLTTAIALTTVFADYLSHELSWGKIRYEHALLITICCILAMTNLGFMGIMKFIEPVALLCYPSIIMLSLSNVAYKLWGFAYTKIVVFVTLGITIYIYYGKTVLAFFS